MKRLLLHGLLGCIMMAQLHGGDRIVSERACQFLGAAAATALPVLALRAGAVAFFNHNLATSLFLPPNTRGIKAIELPTMVEVRQHVSFNKNILTAALDTDGCYGNNGLSMYGKAFHKQENINRWTAGLFFTLLLAATLRLSAHNLPESIREFVTRGFNLPTAAGIAIGAGIPLWFLLPHLSHARVEGTDGKLYCSQAALVKKYTPQYYGRTKYTLWEKVQRNMFLLPR
jgi:hypothetical protein